MTRGLTLTEFSGRPIDAVDLEAFRRAAAGGGRGCRILAAMATVGADGPTGTFIGNDGPLPW